MFERQNLLDTEAAVLSHTLWTSASGSSPTRSPGWEKKPRGCWGGKILHLGVVMGHKIVLTEPTSKEKSVSQSSIREMNGEPPQQQLHKAGVAVGSAATSPATPQHWLRRHMRDSTSWVSSGRTTSPTNCLCPSTTAPERVSWHTLCVCVWHASCTVADRRALKGVVPTAQKIIGCPLLSLDELYSSCCLQVATALSKTHPT